jgi:hypothetical protein
MDRLGAPWLGLASILTVALTLSADRALAQTPALPTLSGPINDFANVIDPDVEQQLDRRIRSLLSASGESVVAGGHRRP